MAAPYHDTGLALGKILHKALEQTLKTSAPNTSWSFKSAEGLSNFAHNHCVVLTISSFKFRIMCLFHLSLNKLTKQFVADACMTKVEDLDESAFLDYLMEMSNSFCGNLKRMMQGTCPPLGMSTPNLLDRSCLTLDNVFNVTHQAHCSAIADYAEPALFAASIFVSLQNPQDFKLPHYQEIEAESEVDNSGELELF
jgi:CheY-specific phosphatase CheX